MDDGPDARKRHDSKANPAEDSHIDYSPDDVENQGRKVNVIVDLSLVHNLCWFWFIWASTPDIHIIIGGFLEKEWQQFSTRLHSESIHDLALTLWILV